MCHVWDFEALSHERVTDLLNLVLVAAKTAENNKVGTLLNIILQEGLEMSQGLSIGVTEEQSLHLLHLLHLDSAGNELQGAVHEWLGGAWVLSVTHGLGRLSPTKVVHHLADEVHDLVVVFELANVGLDFLDGVTLRHHELLTVTHVLLDRIKEQVMAPFLLLLDRGDVAREALW